MSFDSYGSRRRASGTYQWFISSLIYNATNLLNITDKGYTGHEQLDNVGLIHMNGRVYDPTLGRFLSADPNIQAPTDTQSLNRYAYVLNNPLSATDPSGYFGKKLRGCLRTIAAIAITIYTGGLAATAGGWAGFGIAVAGGAAAGFVSTGTLQGALTGAFSAALFYGIGSAFKDCKSCFIKGSDELTRLARAGKVLAHATAGGVMSILNGNKFGFGFVSAGFTQVAAPGIGGIDSSNVGFSVQRVLAAAVVGGTASRLSGGKFANGAITGAFSRAFSSGTRRQARGSAVGGGESGVVPVSRVLTNEDYDWIPADGYESMDAAAKGALTLAKSLGTDTVEYGGGIVKNGEGFWFSEPVTQGLDSDFAAEIIVPSGARLKGIFHTHPNEYKSNLFSSNDTSFSENNTLKSYIGVHKNSSIRFYDPTTMRPRTISGIRNVSRGEQLCGSCF